MPYKQNRKLWRRLLSTNLGRSRLIAKHPRAMFKPQLVITVLLLLFSTLTLFTLSAVDSRFKINPDGISYISIAHQYADGHFESAVNPLLPPLLSWLLVPLFKLGIPGQRAFFGLNIIVALAVLVIGMYLVYRQTKKNLGATILFWIISLPFLIYAVGYSITPDLLVVLWVSLFLLAAIKTEEWLVEHSLKKDIVAGGVLGTLGALGFFTKQFILPFFLTSLIFWFGIRAFVYRKQAKLLSLKGGSYFFRVPIISLVTLTLVSAPWVLAMSAKYNHFVIGNSLTEIFSTKPQAPPNLESNPVALQPPPSKYAIAYNECFCSTDGEQVLYSRKSLDHRSFLVKRINAFPYYLKKISAVWIFTIPVALILGLAFLLRKFSYRQNTAFALAGIFWIIYFVGYASLVSVEFKGGNSRYYWPLFILAALMTSWGLPAAWRLFKSTRKLKIIFLVMIASLSISGFIQYRQLVHALRTPARQSQLQIYSERIQKEGIILPGSKLASNNVRQVRIMAYYLKSQSYGSISQQEATSPKFADPRVQQALKYYSINYYINFAKPGDSALDLGHSGAVIVRAFQIDRLACDNFALAPREPCIITVVRLNLN